MTHKSKRSDKVSGLPLRKVNRHSFMDGFMLISDMLWIGPFKSLDHRGGSSR